MFLNLLNKKITYKKEILIIFILSLGLFFIRWFYSFYLLNEDILTKLIFDSISDGGFFYPIIVFLSEFNLNNSLNPNINNLNNLPIPFGSLIIHTFLFKIFSFYGLILVDFFGYFFALLILFLIFSKFNDNKNSIFLALLLISTPILIDFFEINRSTIIISQVYDLFHLRVHRPFPSNIYFYAFIYLIFHIHESDNLKKIYFFLLGLILALSFSSFYYFFLIEFISLALLVLIKFRKNLIYNLKKNFFNFFLMLTSFLFFSLPFIYFIFSHEPHVSISAGVFELTSQKRSILLDHFSSKYFDFKFLFINIGLLTTVLFFNYKKINNVFYVNILFIIYLSSIISPFLFILLSPKSGILYHFNNNVILCLIICLLSVICLCFNNFFKVKINYKIISTFFIFLLFAYSQNLINKINKNKTLRLEFNKIVNLIEEIDTSNSSLLTFNDQFMLWAILNKKIQYLNLTSSGLTPKTHEMIENDLINVFQYFNLTKNDFLNFFQNKKRGWRFLNQNAQLFFFMKYTANSLQTFNDSVNFDPDILNFIQSTSPLHSQQLIIPNDEFIRFENKFKSHKIKNFIEPEIIILKKDSDIYELIELDKLNFCNLFDGNFFTLYVDYNITNKCKR